MNLKDGRVANAAILELVEKLQEREALTFYEIARRCDWVSSRGAPDGTKVARVLGHSRCVCRKEGKTYYSRQSTMAYDDAVQITRAIGLDPVDVGL